MSYYIVGLSSPNSWPPWPVEATPRFIFCDWNIHMQGYQLAIGAILEPLATGQDCHLFELNNKVVLEAAGLAEMADLLRRLRCELECRPRFWREYVGETIYPGGRRVIENPLLSRSRALRIVDQLERIVEQARAEGKLLLYGNGAAYRALDGKLLPPGAECYS